MYRTIAALIFMIALAIFLRHQFNTVIRQATNPHPVFPAHAPAQESRRKCVMCGGTGRATLFSLGGSGSAKSEPCRSCNGTGWVDNPLYGR